jgi:hypothetical protein
MLLKIFAEILDNRSISISNRCYADLGFSAMQACNETPEVAFRQKCPVKAYFAKVRSQPH